MLFFGFVILNLWKSMKKNKEIKREKRTLT